MSSSGGDFKNAIGSLEWFELAGFRFDNPKVSFRVAGVGYEAEGVAALSGGCLCDCSLSFSIILKSAWLLFGKISLNSGEAERLPLV